MKVETTRQTDTSGQVENAMDVQRGMTDGQSIRPLVDHRRPWKIHWQKHPELVDKEVDRLLKQRTLEPDEDPEKETPMKRAFNTRPVRPSGGSLVVSAQRRFGTAFSALETLTGFSADPMPEVPPGVDLVREISQRTFR